MNSGKWYLYYDMNKVFPNITILETCKRLLDANTKEEAHDEAKKEWEKVNRVCYYHVGNARVVHEFVL